MKKIKEIILGTSIIWLPILFITIGNMISTALGLGIID